MIQVRNAAGAIGIFVLALAARALGWQRVFDESGIMPPHGADEFYHLRRIWYTFRHFPETLSFDSYVNFPVGGEIIMAPGFDLALAALAKALLSSNDQVAVEVIAAWVPAILGALTAVVAAAIAARVFSATAGVIAGVLLALLPGHFHASQVGYVDHHVAVSLGVALLFAGALAVAQRSDSRGWALLAFLLGIGASALLLIWPGSLLHVALLQGLAGVWMIQARSSEVAIARAWHLALAQGAAGLALVPHALGRSWSEFGDFSPLVLSSFQPVWFSACAVACASLAILWARAGIGRHASQRWWVVASVALVAVPTALIAIPELSSSLAAAAGWFVAEEQNFLSGIAEIQPLFGRADSPHELTPQTDLSWLIYVYPLALLWLILRAARTGRSDLWLVAFWGVAFYGLVLAQLRFITSFAIPYTIVWGGALAALLEELRRRSAIQPWPLRSLGALFALALLMFAIQPSASFMREQWGVGPAGSESARPTRRLVRARAYRTAAAWLRENSPTTDGYLDSTQKPQYGVLAAWDMGHLIRYVAERPLVQDNFGVYAGREQFLSGQRYFAAAGEEEAHRILEQLGVRYVLIDRNGASLGQRPLPESMAARLYRARGGHEVIDGRSFLVLPPLGHHRLIMETSLARPQFPHVMVYEIVAGARIEGSAVAGEVVHLRLPVRSRMRAAAFTYRARVVADADGHYGFTVPYATDAGERVLTGGSYVLQCGSESGDVAVAEASIASGATLVGPTLDCLTIR